MSCENTCTTKLTQRLDVEILTETRTAMGGQAQAYTKDAERFGQVRFLAGREMEWAHQVAARATHVVDMRFYPLTPDMRLTFTDRGTGKLVVLNIEAIDRKEYGTHMTRVYCREEQPTDDGS